MQAAMASKPCKLRMLFFPLMTKGHILPMLQMAKMFSTRGVDVTFLTTPVNSSLIRSAMSGSDSSFHLRLLPFPAAVEIQNTSHFFSDFFIPLLEALTMLRQPFDDLIGELLPDCVVSDFLMPWTYHVAAAHGVPRIVFDGFCFFARCVDGAYLKQLSLGVPQPDTDLFVIHDLPHEIKFLRSQIMDPAEWDDRNPIYKIWSEAMEVDPMSYGVIVNSFYELEPDYVDYYRNVVGNKAWCAGPVSLPSQIDSVDDDNECLKWMNGKSSGSVVFICFGSTVDFPSAQLREIALGLEGSGHPFLWVVKSTADDWIPLGFEERMRGNGLLIRGWAPQMRILNHASAGGFVTHCGWNSCIESITAGIAMATWPLFAEQFYNEKLMVDLLGIGVAVGSKEYKLGVEEKEEVVPAAAVETAVRRLLGGGDESDERRRRVRDLAATARSTVEEGGSSYSDVGRLIHELMEMKKGD